MSTSPTIPPDQTTADGVPTWAAEVAGDSRFRNTTAEDAVAGVQAAVVIEPGDAAELAAVLRRASAGGIAVVPRGSGTKLGWGLPPRSAQIVLSTSRLGAVVEHAAGDLTVTVQAGCTIDRLQAVLAEQGQRLALDPLFPASATVGGMLATGDSGSLRGAFGPPRDQVIGTTAALVDGTLARSGGRVVKNVAGYDLPKLFTGSLGTLGVITEATFRLYPLPHLSQTVAFASPDEESAARFLHVVHSSTLAVTGAQLHAGGGTTPEAHVRLDGFAERSIQDRLGRLEPVAREHGLGDAGESASEVWHIRERLYAPSREAITTRIGFLPARLPQLLQRIRSIAGDAVRWELVAQAAGTADLRFSAGDPLALAACAGQVAMEVRRLAGTFVIREADPSLLAELDVWGPTGDAFPLMQRVKEQFDPGRILNPGRYVGGI